VLKSGGSLLNTECVKPAAGCLFTKPKIYQQGISLLPTTYKILSNILLSRFTPYAEEIIGDHQYGFRRSRTTTAHIFCIRQILEKKWEYNEAVHQLFIDFKKAYESVRREVLYNIVNEFGIPMKLARLIKMCLTETYSKVWVGKNLSDMCPIRNGLKRGMLCHHCFSTLLKSTPLGGFR